MRSSAKDERPGLRLLLRDAPGAERADQTVWTVEVRAIEADQKLHIMVETGMETDDPATRIQIGRPRVIDDLLALCPSPALGSSPISKDVIDLGVKDIPALVTLLREPTRTLPLIVFSEPTGSGDQRWRELARRTATRSRGFATVVRLDGDAVTALRDTLGRLGVWGGGVRTYAPAPLDVLTGHVD